MAQDDDLATLYESMENPFARVLEPDYRAQPQGAARYARLALKGATLGFAGKDVESESIADVAAEMVGSIPTIALTGGVVGGALRAGKLGTQLARLGPAASRLTGAGGAGAVYGAAKEAISGEDVTPASIAEAAGRESAWWTLGELVPVAWAARRNVNMMRPGSPVKDVSDVAETVITPSIKRIEIEQQAEEATKRMVNETRMNQMYKDAQSMLGRVANDEEIKAMNLPMAAPGTNMARTHIPRYTVEVRPQTRLETLENGETVEVAIAGQGMPSMPQIIDKNTGRAHSIEDFTFSDDPKTLVTRAVKGLKRGAQLSKERDPVTNTDVFVAVSPDAENALRMASHEVRLTSPPVDEAMLQKPEIRTQLERSTVQRENSTTDNLLKLSEKTLDEQIDARISTLGEVTEITHSEGSIAIREFAARNGLTLGEMNQIVANADALVRAGTFADDAARSTARLQAILAELRKRCP